MDKGHALFQELLTAHRSGAEKKLDELIEQLYHLYRPAFLSWAQHEWKLSAYYASEAYQKTILVFYLNLKSGKLHTLTSTLKTYIFGIGKRVVQELRREDSKSTPYDEMATLPNEPDMGYLEREEQAHRLQIVEELLQQLSEKCRKILDMYYFRNFSMEAIAQRMNYSSIDVAKKSKYECMRRLRKLAKSNSFKS
ncbi:MAG: sigma-70 family RNA polymerase sigma factor [Bacteroidetes bacterium]|nr:MAG: sigma-70 family RNA polymerase sigma factor [Bacteroidota bacterium]